MASRSVTFDALNRELRNVVSYFEDAVPDNLRWTIDSHVHIVPGATLGYWDWPDGTATAIVAPPGCDGFIIDISDRVSCPLLGTPPSQYLLILD